MTMVANVVERLNLDSLFESDLLAYDLREGVTFNPARTRLCLLSTDLLNGVYKALEEEAGPAWRLIFKHCGRVWGQRLCRRLDRECMALAGKQLRDLPLEDFLSFVDRYFAFHGWGRVQLDVSHAPQTGIVEATLANSLFAAVITSGEEMVDSMICGILASLLGHLSGAELDCVQTACSSQGVELSRFLISAAIRLESAEDRVKSGETHAALLASL
jgi:predicted hydrocarbon binding protein